MPKLRIFVFKRNFDFLPVFFDDEDSGIDVFGFYWEGVAGVAVEGFAGFWFVDLGLVGFGVVKF